MDQAVSFTWDIGIRDVVFETDSSTVSDVLNGSTTPPIAIANLIADTQHRLQEFKQTYLQHVKRQGNKPTHFLAKHVKGIDSFVTRKIYILLNHFSFL